MLHLAILNLILQLVEKAIKKLIYQGQSEDKEREMKTMNVVKLVASLLLLAMVSSLAVAQIATSEHDLSGTNTKDNSQICVYCHTPHNANGGVVPLWNRDFTTSSFIMYDSPTLDMTIASAPQGVSLACLSCHDGTIAVDQLFGDPWGASGSTHKVGGDAKLGTNLSNDHPISITYDTTADTAFVAASAGKVGTLPLFGTTAAPGAGDQVECASCHSVHDDSIMPFLRKSNAGSALCLTCHIK